MAIKRDIDVSAANAINDVFNRASKFLGQGVRLLDTDFNDLLVKAADFRISQLGTPVLDHVTFYSDVLNTGDTSGAYRKQALPLERNKIGDIKVKKDYIYENFQRQITKLEQVFKFKDNIQNPNYYSVTVDNVAIRLSQANRIVRTAVEGENGTIKEFTSKDDYTISFDILLAGANPYQTDTRTLKQLEALFSFPFPLRVNSIYLNNIFDITYIYVDSMDVTQNRDYGNLTTLSINAYSDKGNYQLIEEETF